MWTPKPGRKTVIIVGRHGEIIVVHGDLTLMETNVWSGDTIARVRRGVEAEGPHWDVARRVAEDLCVMLNFLGHDAVVEVRT